MGLSKCLVALKICVFLKRCFNKIAGVALYNTKHTALYVLATEHDTYTVEASPAEVDGTTYS